MRKAIFRCISAVLIVLMLVSVCVTYASAKQQATSNRFNVVFAIDSSGSMSDTDPDKLRFDATELFLGLLANDGNYVGGLVFNNGVVEKSDIAGIKGMSDKEKVQGIMKGAKIVGGTDIGLALQESVKMIEEKGNKALPSAIILLSDGNTDLASEELYKESNIAKASAIQKARNNDYKVYSVCLNVDGSADKKELSQISNATSGECFEIKNSSDLNNIFAKFYNLIYSTSTTKIDDSEIPKNGKIHQVFNVPSTGVEEVNIIVSSSQPISNMTLKKPDGTVMSADEVKKITSSSRAFTITKLVEPEGGAWEINATGKAGDKVKIEMVCNDRLSLNLQCDKADGLKKGDKVQVKGYLLDNNETVSDKAAYKDYKAVLCVTKQTSADSNQEGEPDKYEMNADGASYTYTLPLDEYATYILYMEADGDGISKSTKEDRIVLNVGNTAPVVNEEKIEQHFWLLPFTQNSGDIDLSTAVTDAEDKNLTYTVKSSSFLDTSYEIDNATLKMKDFDLPEGSFTIKAADSMGASAEFEVAVTTTDVGILTLIILGAIILIVLAVIGVVTYILLNKRFMGDCYASSYNYETGEYSEEVKCSMNRGRIKLTSFGLSVPGLDLRKCYFQATGKDYVYFCSNKPVYGDGMKAKKIRVDGRQITISKDSSAQCGIKVRFDSMKSNGSSWF